jgi:hypothetical protein
MRTFQEIKVMQVVQVVQGKATCWGFQNRRRDPPQRFAGRAALIKDTK